MKLAIAEITPAESTSPFFRLPRELRNAIYSSLPKTLRRLFPEEMDRRAGYTFDTFAPVKTFRLISRRFTSEYDEQMLATSTLKVWQAFKQDLRLSYLPTSLHREIELFRNLEVFVDTDCHGPARPAEYLNRGYDAETDLLNHRECLEELVDGLPNLVRARIVLLVRTVRCDDFGLRDFKLWDEPEKGSAVHQTMAELVKAPFWRERLDEVNIWHKRQPPQWLGLGTGDELCAVWTFKGGWKSRSGIFYTTERSSDFQPKRSPREPVSKLVMGEDMQFVQDVQMI